MADPKDEITTADILAQYGPTPQAKPKDEHGFLFSNVGGELKFNPWEHIKGFMGYRAPPGALSTSGDSKPIEDAFNAAGWVGLSGMGLNAFGAVPANAVGSAGARLAGKAMPAVERELDPLGFYSAALEGAKSWPMERGSPQQALAHLKKSGTKDAEIAATGLDKYLAEQDVVTRQAMEDYLRQNRVQLKENKYGGNEAAQEKWLEQAREREIESTLGEYEIRQDPDGYWRTYLYDEPLSRRGHTSEGAAEDMLRDTVHSDILGWSDRELRERGFGDRASKQEELLWPSDVKDKAKWQKYALDTENPTYRESVLHMEPNRAGQKVVPHPDGSGFTIQGRDGQYAQMPGDRLPTRWSTERGAELAMNGDKNSTLGVDHTPAFRSGHWSEPNVVAHMRHSIQPDEAGRPTFLIDELQSDWGQKLREGGVRDEAKIADLRRRFEEADKKYDALDFHNLKMSEVMAHPVTQERNLLQAELRTAEAMANGHPLVNTTDQWTTTGIRRLLQQAAEADAAGIALTPGQLQNERFNLSKHVGALRYSPDAGSLQYLERDVAQLPPVRRDHRWNTYGSGDIKPEDLPGIVGKELAEKLLQAERVPMGNGSPYEAHTLHDLGSVEVGGGGMKYAYDSMYPKKIAKELKKLDPEHPGYTQRRLTAPENSELGYEIIGHGTPDRRAVLEDPFHYFELTPKAKEEIRKGLPLFSMPGIPVADLLRAYYGEEKE